MRHDLQVTVKPSPRFSVIIETENLAAEKDRGLSRMLDSLNRQDLPLSAGIEVVLVDTVGLSQEQAAALLIRYPWLRVLRAPSRTDYYQAKMLGARRATGEVLVFCDCDCVYEPAWLRNMVTPFNESHEVQIVAGETATDGKGIYGTAMALAYIFPPHSDDTALAPTGRYFMNNVAFRRALLIGFPIPHGTGLYRGNCALHSYRLRADGYVIWRQPQARAWHAPPNGAPHFLRRFILIGHDYYRQKCLLALTDARSSDPVARTALLGRPSMLAVFRERLVRLARDERHGVFRLLVSLPIVSAAVALIVFGYLVEAVTAVFRRLRLGVCVSR